jgi:hypothetical protein
LECQKSSSLCSCKLQSWHFDTVDPHLPPLYTLH